LSTATTFTVDQADLISGGTVQGSSGGDTLSIGATALDLRSTTLSGVEIIKAGLSTATTFTVNQADLLSGGTVQGSSGNDSIAAGDTALDLTSTTLSSVEIIKAGTASATTFTVNQTDMLSGGTIQGGASS